MLEIVPESEIQKLRLSVRIPLIKDRQVGNSKSGRLSPIGFFIRLFHL